MRPWQHSLQWLVALETEMKTQRGWWLVGIDEVDD